MILFVFVFKQMTAYAMRISDWSSDVCSPDLQPLTYCSSIPVLSPSPERRDLLIPLVAAAGPLPPWRADRPRQYTTTERMDLPSCMRSKPLLMSLSGRVWVMRSSMWIFPSMYQLTILGTSVRPPAPPTQVPLPTRPVEGWQGRREE